MAQQPWEVSVQDWVLLAFLGVCGAYSEIAKPSIERFFVEQDPTLSRPYVAASVSTPALVVLSVFVPLAILLAMARKNAFECPRVTLSSVSLSFGMCICTQWFAVALLKGLCGRQRPNFFAFCNYHGYADAMDEYLETGSRLLLDVYFNKTQLGRPGNFSHCQGSDKHIAESRLSFPSGHTSFSFSGLGFLGLCLAAAARQQQKPTAVSVVGLLAPLLLAALVAATRVQEYFHNESDILGGGVIGFLSAWWAFSTRLSPAWEAFPDAETDKQRNVADSPSVLEMGTSETSFRARD